MTVSSHTLYKTYKKGSLVATVVTPFFIAVRFVASTDFLIVVELIHSTVMMHFDNSILHHV